MLVRMRGSTFTVIQGHEIIMPKCDATVKIISSFFYHDLFLFCNHRRTTKIKIRNHANVLFKQIKLTMRVQLGCIQRKSLIFFLFKFMEIRMTFGRIVMLNIFIHTYEHFVFRLNLY